ncbi:hypothetical protein IM543_07995 [Massilia sp. UMI-21]|nr:hypothetical protein IM543_07995 [Massilia sp. UMI-21]
MSSVTTAHAIYRSPPGPVHAILLGGSVSLFLGALLSDFAYYNTYHIQWTIFASWLVAGGLLFSGLALVFALVSLVRAERKAGRTLAYFVLLLVTWVLGLVNAFEHAKDAWAAMPASLILSVVVAILICIAAWLRFNPHSGDTQ